MSIETTHYEGCYDAGRKHYECALNEIKRLREERNQALIDLEKTREERNRARKWALEQLQGPQKLRPMGEAPKDGTFILLYAANDRLPVAGYFFDESWSDEDGFPFWFTVIGWLPLPEVNLGETE